MRKFKIDSKWAAVITDPDLDYTFEESRKSLYWRQLPKGHLERIYSNPQGEILILTTVGSCKIPEQWFYQNSDGVVEAEGLTLASLQKFLGVEENGSV